MRRINRDIEITVDGTRQGFRLFKPDAFSGVMLLRLLMRLEDGRIGERIGGDGSPTVRESGVRENRPQRSAPTLLDLIASLSEAELRAVMTAVLNHVSVLLPAGPHPVMTGSEWGYPELEHDTPSCMKLLLEEIAWSLQGFFGGGQPKAEAGRPDTPP